MAEQPGQPRGNSAKGPHGGGSKGGKAGKGAKGNEAEERSEVAAKPAAHRAKIERKLAKECPKRTDKQTCKRLVQGYIETGKSTATAVSQPDECTEAMSKPECEELLTKQKAAAETAEESSPVVVEECVAHPTPRCERILGEAFEHQQAAQQGQE